MRNVYISYRKLTSCVEQYLSRLCSVKKPISSNICHVRQSLTDFAEKQQKLNEQCRELEPMIADDCLREDALLEISNIEYALSQVISQN